MNAEKATTILAALANTARLEVFRLLVAKGGLPAGEMARKLGVAPSTLSFQLKELRQAGLVTSKRQGRHIIYTADIKTLNGILGFLVDDCCSGRPDLCIRTIKPAPSRGKKSA